MKVAIAADHRGASMIAHVVQLLQQHGCEVVECSPASTRMCDYPDMAFPVAQAVAAGAAERGILICGSGIGMSIAANKVKGVRAALVHDEIGAEISRRHNDANVLCLPADLLGVKLVERIVAMWINAGFEGGRHARRVAKIAAIEDGRDPTLITDTEEATTG